MTRELKIALLIGFCLVLVVSVLIADHLSAARSAEDWNAHRLRLGQYVTTFRDCVDLLQDRYVPALRKLFGPVPLKAAFDEDAAPMRTLCDAFLTVRDRVEACRQGSLRVRISTGKLIEPPLFNHDLLSTSTWKRIAPRIHRAREVLVQLEVAA